MGGISLPDTGSMASVPPAGPRLLHAWSEARLQSLFTGLEKRRFIIGSLLMTPKPGKQPLCRIKVVKGPGKFNPFRQHPLWQNEPFHNQCKLILTFDIDHCHHRTPPPHIHTHTHLWDCYCNFAGHLIRYLAHHKSIVISKKGGWSGGGGC